MNYDPTKAYHVETIDPKVVIKVNPMSAIDKRYSRLNIIDSKDYPLELVKNLEEFYKNDLLWNLNVNEILSSSKIQLIDNLLLDECPSIKIYKSSDIIVLNEKDFITTFVDSEHIFDQYCYNTELTKAEAIADFQSYMLNKRIRINQTGLENFVNNFSNKSLYMGTSSHLGHVLTECQTTGLCGKAMLTTYPYMIIAIPATLGIALLGIECLTKGTILGQICRVSAEVCLIPLKSFEYSIQLLLFNPLNRIFSKNFSINATDQLLNGRGLNAKIPLKDITPIREINNNKLDNNNLIIRINKKINKFICNFKKRK